MAFDSHVKGIITEMNMSLKELAKEVIRDKRMKRPTLAYFLV
jgi:hypothetical protein